MYGFVMKSVQSVYEAKAHLSSLLAEVASTGATFVICKHGLPVADLVQHRSVNDPFDRVLIAECRLNRFSLVSADRVLPLYPEVDVIW